VHHATWYKNAGCARGGLVRGTGQFVEHLVRNLLFLITGLIILYFGGSFVLHWLGGFVPHFGWPDWLHLPHWFGSNTATTMPSPAGVETVTTPSEPAGSCNGWGWKFICWKN
jgi:hypothetical protein